MNKLYLGIITGLATVVLALGVGLAYERGHNSGYNEGWNDGTAYELEKHEQGAAASYATEVLDI